MASTRSRRRDENDEILECPARTLLQFREERNGKKGTWKPGRRMKGWLKQTTKQPWFVLDKWDGNKFTETAQGWCLEMSDITKIENKTIHESDAVIFLVENKKTPVHGDVGFALHAVDKKAKGGKKIWHFAARSPGEREMWIRWILTFVTHMNLTDDRIHDSITTATTHTTPTSFGVHQSYRTSFSNPSITTSPSVSMSPGDELRVFHETLKEGNRISDVVSGRAHRARDFDGPNYAGETRIDGLDGREYTYDEYVAYYGLLAREKWLRSAMAPYGSQGVPPGVDADTRQRVVFSSPKFTPPSPAGIGMVNMADPLRGGYPSKTMSPIRMRELPE